MFSRARISTFIPVSKSIFLSCEIFLLLTIQENQRQKNAIENKHQRNDVFFSTDKVLDSLPFRLNVDDDCDDTSNDCAKKKKKN